MSFASWGFLLFFCAFIPLTFIIPKKIKLVYILIVSYLFYYFGNGVFILILIFSTIADYLIGKAISNSDDPLHRKLFLGASIGFNLGLIVIFRYLDNLIEVLIPLLNNRIPNLSISELSIAAPIGLSFFTFTKIAYVVDIYQRKTKPERSLLSFSTTIAFFPNVTAGPIERVEHLLPQLKLAGRFNEQKTTEGLRLILWGTFKKIVVASLLSPYVDLVYENPQNFQGLALIIATLFFAFQIYADFSGYSDIAIGIAKILGVNLFENFKQPYLSRSILEFWRRWHMSLTNWVRAYLFMPFSRNMLKRTNRNHGRLIEISAYLLVMSIVGLWHGFSLTFLVWGLLHGVYMSVETMLPSRLRRAMPKTRLVFRINIVITFLLVTFAWIFFRAESFYDALYIITHMFSFNSRMFGNGVIFPFGSFNFILAALLIILLVISDLLSETGYINLINGKRMIVARWGLYYAALIAIWVMLLGSNSSADFIYFQF